MTDSPQIKSTFISAVLRETAETIQSRQRQVASEWNLFESGDLKRSLQGHFSVNASDGGGKLSMSYLSYARFLDMNNPNRKIKREGYHLYNRIVFGVLYNPTVAALQYGLTDEIRTFLGEKIQEALMQNMPVYRFTSVALRQLGDIDPDIAKLFSR
jgi:hypothetical protein